jgi:S1-C subfamily serine protease
MTIAEPSVQSLFLVAMANGLELGTGTGFVLLHNEKPYLITNYHVAAGRNPNDGQPRHPSGAVPDTLRVLHLMPQRQGRIEWQPRDERVLMSDPERALWFQHPVYGRSVDVVALPLRNTGGVELHPYVISGSSHALRTGPSEGVSIVGFPFGITGGGAFAIWTRGFIASEPDVDLNDLPSFLIDARTRPGQSGSPVISYSSGGPTPMANGALAFMNGPVTNLLGVYSGRINDQSDLGIVWKAKAVVDILGALQPGVAGL